MLRKISFALVAAAALGTAALAPTSASARGHGGHGFHGGGHGSWGHRDFGYRSWGHRDFRAAVGRAGAITIHAAADNGGEKAGPRWPGRFSAQPAQIG